MALKNQERKAISLDPPSIAKSNKAKSILLEIGFLLVGAILFSLSFPGYVFRWGGGALGFIALIPVFYVVSQTTWIRAPLYGAFYGFICYVLFNFWLATFHPLAIFIVPLIYFTYLLLTFPFLKLSVWLFPRYGYLVQILVWISYEYLRTKGFLGYSYGIMGYSQYLFLPFIQIASITGVWGVSALVVFPSAFLAAAFASESLVRFFRLHKWDLAVYGLFILAVFGYGFSSPVDYSQARKWKLALIQHNIDPWKGGYWAYRTNLERLIRLSNQALKESPEMVVWSETAFVPGIDWHTRYREDPDVYELVQQLRSYLSAQEVPFVFGNDDGRLEKDRYGNLRRVDYNAALLFDKGEIQNIYRKVHLVPFTEHFPYERIFPWFYQKLKEADTHFWEPGQEFVVFRASGVSFSTPICFEDAFGYISREFVRRGAEVIINLTNDSWSGHVAAAMQHMSKAVFRAIENRRSVVRCSNGGMTCVIDPNGKILQILDPFIEGYLIGTVPVYISTQTLYTKWGDWFAQLCLLLGISLLAVGTIRKWRFLSSK
ncbi:MAG: apolipoprotein N-acyltransferase [Spirochaetales bacterium]